MPRGGPRSGNYDLRWFTPRCEVSLCGHATLASAYVVLNLLQAGLQTVRFETRRSGLLSVSKDSNMFAMDFPAMPGKTCPNPPKALLQALGEDPRPTSRWKPTTLTLPFTKTKPPSRTSAPILRRWSSCILLQFQ